MADIKALRAWRYDFTAAGAPDTLITQPYDVISPAAQQAYYAANPYNIIRLEWGQIYEDDNAQHNRYTRAAADFAAWKDAGILKRDDEPCIYPYIQEFSVEGQRYRRGGFLAALKAGGYEDGWVLPHEETLPGHKEDRYRLMQACLANFSPVFGLYNDSSQAIDKALRQAIEGMEPIVDVTDEAGVRHLLWRVSDNNVVKQVEQAMAAQKIYIADGHHRYETASRFAADAAAGGQNNCDRLLIQLVNIHNPGLVVLPTHRLVKNLEDFSAPALLQALTDAGFAEFPMPDLASLQEHLASMHEEEAGFGLYMEGTYYLLSIDRADLLIAAAQPGYHPSYQRLDVSIAHALILEALCGVGKAELASGKNLDYCHDAQEAVDTVKQGDYNFALLLNSTRITELLAVANNGEKMPQKSTYFYPKVIAGLLINQLG